MPRLMTLDELVSAAFLRLDLEDTRDENVFREWAWDSARELGPTRLDKKTTCIDICDFGFEFPCDYISALDMNLLDANGGVYSYRYGEAGFMESEVNNSGPTGQSSRLNGGFNRLVLTEAKQRFLVSSNAAEIGITSAQLTYYAAPVNENGEMLIEESMQEAMICFIEYMYIKRERNKDRNKIPMSEVDYYGTQWRNKRMEVRGARKVPDPLAMDTIARRWVTGVANFQNKRRHTR